MPKDGDFEALLEFLKRTRGFDFTGYKRPSLMRRIERRMDLVGIDSFDRYVDHLEVDPEEFTALFNTILINVTGFFRDPPIWSYLETDVIPGIIKASNDGPIRVWSAACASGEEPYSAAMLLAEALGKEQFLDRVKIYGTDLDEEALGQARQAVYSEKSLGPVSDALRRTYFKKQGSGWAFDKELRRALIFGRHDLVRDVPISRIDLLFCRNVLMYFNVDTQTKVISNLNFALNDGGFLVLGKAEMLAARSKLLTPVDLRRRVFTKPRGARHPDDSTARPPLDPDEAARLMDDVHGRHGAFEAGPLAQLVVDREGALVLANAHARDRFGISKGDLGKPFRELDVSYRPAELRTPIDEVTRTRQPAALSDVRHVTPEGETHLDIDLLPLSDPHGEFVGVGVAFRDVTSYVHLREELEQANQELETAMEELQSTNEELETTNEELQSTNEELETTNEELQSTNEELETMNEELQSTNEELGTVNDEMRERTGALNELNTFMHSILSSIRAAVITLDRSMLVTEWNRAAEELWGLRADEVQEQPFFTLEIGLPVEKLQPFIKSCLEEGAVHADVKVSATNRRGRSLEMSVTCGPLRRASGKTDGVILVMEPSPADGTAKR
jgi:two-component system, chemotaxis family, CheB/CheR fusion protein